MMQQRGLNKQLKEKKHNKRENGYLRAALFVEMGFNFGIYFYLLLKARHNFSSQSKQRKGRASSGDSYLSEVWGRDKPRHTFPPQMRRDCFKPSTLTAAPGLPFSPKARKKEKKMFMAQHAIYLSSHQPPIKV